MNKFLTYVICFSLTFSCAASTRRQPRSSELVPLISSAAGGLLVAVNLVLLHRVRHSRRWVNKVIKDGKNHQAQAIRGLKYEVRQLSMTDEMSESGEEQPLKAITEGEVVQQEQSMPTAEPAPEEQAGGAAVDPQALWQGFVYQECNPYWDPYGFWPWQWVQQWWQGQQQWEAYQQQQAAVYWQQYQQQLFQQQQQMAALVDQAARGCVDAERGTE